MRDANRDALEQMQWIRQIVEEIDTWPAELQAFEVHPEVFGSWSLIVRRNGQRTRFSYDGKEGYVSAARLPPDASDFTQRPRALAGIGLAHGLDARSVADVIAFVKAQS